MTIQNIDIHKIIPYENNPRKNDNAVDKVAECIQKKKKKNPIIIDKNNVIVCGHTRVKAAVKLGLKTVPCIYADDLTDEQVKAFRLIDNKTAEYAQWDFDKLELEWSESIDDMLKPFDFNIGSIDTYDFAEMSINESSLDIQKKQTHSGNKRKIPLSEEEFNKLNELIDNYITDNGVVFGFIRSLIQ